MVTDKVRINPGNFVDPGRTFKKLEYTDEEYAAELTLGKQCAYAYRALYTAVLAVTRLGHAEMQRKVHTLVIHSVDCCATPAQMCRWWRIYTSIPRLRLPPPW